MSARISNKIENRSILDPEDGLLDVFVGFGIFLAGLFMWTEMVWMVAIFVPILFPGMQAARKRFLQSRIGNLDHDPQLQARAQKILFIVTFLLGVLLLAAVGMFLAFEEISGPVNDWVRQYFLLLLGCVLAGVWALAAALLKIGRFYLYGVFTLVTFGAAQITTLQFWMALSILGGLIVLVGLLLLIRFVQQHPTLD